jgi:hypothetical protein
MTRRGAKVRADEDIGPYAKAKPDFHGVSIFMENPLTFHPIVLN